MIIEKEYTLEDKILKLTAIEKLKTNDINN